MMPTLQAYQVTPATEAVAAWLQHLLGPVLVACRFRWTPPIELRPTGAYRGWCAPLDMAPDGRVDLSGRARFWSRRDLIATYLHESAHRLLPGHEHDPAFACLNMTWLLCTDAAGLTENAATVCTNLYNSSDLPVELADEPAQGLGRSIASSVLTAHELAQTELDAEDLAAEIVCRFDQWIAEVAGEPARCERRLRQVGRQQEVGERLREKVWTLNLVASVLSVLVASLIVAGFK